MVTHDLIIIGHDVCGGEHERLWVARCLSPKVGELVDAEQLDYADLPEPIRETIGEDEFYRARPYLVPEGETIQRAGPYLNMDNGKVKTYERGDVADGDLLPIYPPPAS